MRFIPLFFMLSSLGFFWVFMGNPSLPRAQRPSPLVHLLPGIPSTPSPGAVLWKALVTGDDRGLSRENKKTYFRLGLGHLFTPSGVHLATLEPLLRFIPHLSWFYLLIASLGWQVPGLAALSRVAWLKAIPAGDRSWLIFASALLLEGMALSWRTHSLSWTCSWLFLSLCWFSPQRLRPLWFLLAQMLVSWVFQQPLSLLAPLANILAALPLALIFPMIFFLSPCPHFFLHAWAEKALTQFHHGVLWLDQSHHFLPALAPHAGHVICGLMWLLLPAKRRHWLALSLLLLLAPLELQKKKAYSLSQWEITPAPRAQIIKQEKFKSVWSDGTKCQLYWKGDGWEEVCRSTIRKSGKRIKTRKPSSKK